MTRLGAHRRRVGVALLVAAAALVPAAAAAQAAGPAVDWVGLAGGRVGDYQWSVKVKRPEVETSAERANGMRTCLMVGATWPVGRYSYGRIKARQCSGSHRLTAAEPPLIAAGPQPGHGAGAKVTAVGMVFAPAARRLRITLPDGGVKTIQLQSIGRNQAQDARLARLRYAAFVVRGTWCAERLVSENAAGRALWDSGTDGYACAPAP